MYSIIFSWAYRKSIHEMTSDKLQQQKKGGQLFSITDLFTLLLTNCTFSFFDYYLKGKGKIKCKYVYIVIKQNVDKRLPVVLKIIFVLKQIRCVSWISTSYIDLSVQERPSHEFHETRRCRPGLS
jgi:hypothetical protein